MNMYKIKDHPNLSFKLINRVTGWVTFVIASMTYILTAESTASLWDCGEFITTSVGLQVGHPPRSTVIYDYFAVVCDICSIGRYPSLYDQLYVGHLFRADHFIPVLVDHSPGP